MVFRVQASFEATQPLQRGDRYMNVFHYTEGSPVGTFTELMDAVRDFYNAVPTTQGVPVARFLSNAVSRAAGSAIIDVYDLDDPTPRAPVASMAFTPGASGSSNRLPGEVACVVSLRGAMVGGINRQRLRGRTFLGPLVDDCIVPTSGLFTEAFMLTVGGSAEEHLMDGAGTWELVVYSDSARDNSDQEIPYDQRPLLPPIATPVVRIEVDNAPDTQRRRGRGSTDRLEFGA